MKKLYLTARIFQRSLKKSAQESEDLSHFLREEEKLFPESLDPEDVELIPSSKGPKSSYKKPIDVRQNVATRGDTALQAILGISNTLGKKVSELTDKLSDFDDIAGAASTQINNFYTDLSQAKSKIERSKFLMDSAILEYDESLKAPRSVTRLEKIESSSSLIEEAFKEYSEGKAALDRAGQKCNFHFLERLNASCGNLKDFKKETESRYQELSVLYRLIQSQALKD